MEEKSEKILQSAHSHPADTVARELGVDHGLGLSSAEAAARLERDGPNAITSEAGYSLWRILIGQFSSIVIWLLAAAAAVAFFTENALEGSAILVVMILNAGIGFAIEWQAGRSLDALKRSTKTAARVRREGNDLVIDAEELVVGDIINLTSGDRVPADARLYESANLRADESALTGESFPVSKSMESVPKASILTERYSMIYLGTTIVSGRGSAIVTATGEHTEIGRVGQLLAKTKSDKTPLERKLESLGKLLVYLVLAIAAIVMLAGFLRGDDPALMFEVSISLAVAAIPEALPAMTTLILALGVLRMARQNAIVRKLSAVETLGSTTVICSDKTGTLTENRMTVQEYRLANDRVFRLDDGSDGDSPTRLIRVSILCNDAAIDLAKSDDPGVGDPTETALLVAARASKIDVARERLKFEKLSEQPFDAMSRRMIVVFRDRATEKTFGTAKGAPAVILEMCNRLDAGKDGDLPLDDATRTRFLSVNEEMAGRGLRVLALAERSIDNITDDEELGYTFLGFAGMTDPPRPGVGEAIRLAQAAGIRVVMLTGDQALTAEVIARQLDLSSGGDIFTMHASSMVGANDAYLADAARQAHVFARVSPEDKLRIVEVLQKSGEIVSVTGDGINDAPALKRADIGIAMGMRGTEVAKEAADIILTDDNFSTIVKAIEGGRTIYANIIKFVHLMFSKNLGEVLVIFVAIVAGLPLPLLPLQILWLNLVTDVFPAFALAVEPASALTMRQRPRPPNDSLISRRFLFLISWQGVLQAAIALLVYIWALGAYGEGPHSRTMALMAIVGSQLGHMFNCRSRTRSAFNGFFSNPYIFVAAASMVLLQIMAIYLAPLARILETTVPNAIDYAVIGASVILPIIIVEITKAFSNRRSPD